MFCSKTNTAKIRWTAGPLARQHRMKHFGNYNPASPRTLGWGRWYFFIVGKSIKRINTHTHIDTNFLLEFPWLPKKSRGKIKWGNSYEPRLPSPTYKTSDALSLFFLYFELHMFYAAFMCFLYCCNYIYIFLYLYRPILSLSLNFVQTRYEMIHAQQRGGVAV